MEARDTMPRHQVAARDHSARAPQRRCASSVRHAPRHAIAPKREQGLARSTTRTVSTRPREAGQDHAPRLGPSTPSRTRPAGQIQATRGPAAPSRGTPARGRGPRGRARSGPPAPLTPCHHQLLDRSAEFVAVKPPRLIRVQRLSLPLAQPGIECDKGQPSRSARPAGPLAQPARSAMSGSSGRQALAAGDAHRAHHN